MNVVTNVYYTEQGEIERYTTGLPPMPDPKPGQSVITLQRDDMWVNPSLCYVEGGALRDMPPRPSEGHTFDYANKQWVDPRTQATEWPLVRAKRDRLLLQSDWTQLPDVPPETRATWTAYRQALRDVTEQPDPFAIEWPAPPA